MIDEKKLIDGSTWHPNVLTKKEPSYQDGWNDCNRDWMKRIAELPNVPDINDGRKWIPVSERLPEEEGKYLVFATMYFTPGHIDECDHYDDIGICGYYPDYGFAGEYGFFIKAWQPLPEPFKE